MTDFEDREVPNPNEKTLRPIGSLFDDALRRAQARADGTEKPIPVPWPSVAAQLGGGFWPGAHVLVSGTGVGKSTFALQVAMHAAKQGHAVGYVGLELDDLQIALRVLAEEAKGRWSKLYTGQAGPRDIEDAKKAAETLRALPLFVEVGNPQGWPASELATMAKALRERCPDKPPMIVLDFLQLVGDEPEAARRTELRERIGGAAYVARSVAREHDVVVLLVSSTARQNYDLTSGKALKGAIAIRGDRRAMFNPDDFVGLGKESGEVEFSADSVSVLVRSPVNTTQAETSEASSLVLLTAKGRATGAAWCAFTFNGYRFTEESDHAELMSLLNAKLSKAGKKTDDDQFATIEDEIELATKSVKASTSELRKLEKALAASTNGDRRAELEEEIAAQRSAVEANEAHLAQLNAGRSSARAALRGTNTDAIEVKRKVLSEAIKAARSEVSDIKKRIEGEGDADLLVQLEHELATKRQKVNELTTQLEKLSEEIGGGAHE